MKSWEILLRDNSAEQWALAMAIVFVLLVAMWAARKLGARLLTRFSRATAPRVGDAFADAVRATRLWLLAPVAIYAGASAMELPARLDQLLHNLAMVGVVAQVAVWGNRLLVFWLARRATDQRDTDPAAATTVTLIGFVARTLVWALALMLALDQLGFNVTTLIAGLGIGGIAVALALQSILGDLFASAAIVLDKPFVIGDFIVLGDFAGTVEKVGLKTTRVRSLGGEQLVFANAQMLNGQIRNYKRMQERRILFGIGVTYETPLEKLRALPGWLREAVQSQPAVRFDRAHFKEYAEFSLNFEIVYYVLSPDYNKYMDVQQAINLAIFDKCAREGVQFAYPTRTLYLRREAGA